MSTKLVKRGLELVLGDESLSAAKKPKRKKVKKKRKRVLAQDKDDKTDNSKKNLQYFLGTTWSLKEDTQEKILEHQARRRKDVTVKDNEETDDKDDDWIFNFDLQDVV